MSGQWFYRIRGKEFGPVALDLVRSLAATGTIACDDEVRDAQKSTWLLACCATELKDSINSPIPDLPTERRSARDEWFCRGASGEVGPLKLAELIKFAADGDLAPDEEIKAKADDYWKQVRSIQRLIDLLPFSEGDWRDPANSNGSSRLNYQVPNHGDGSSTEQVACEQEFRAGNAVDVIPFSRPASWSSTFEPVNVNRTSLQDDGSFVSVLFASRESRLIDDDNGDD